MFKFLLRFSLRGAATLHFKNRPWRSETWLFFCEVFSIPCGLCRLWRAHGVCVAGSFCGNFRPPYTRTDSQITAPAIYISLREKKKRKRKKKKKSLGKKRGKKNGGVTINLHGEKMMLEIAQTENSPLE